MDLRTVYETEKMIMNRVGWKLHLITPRDLQEEILREVFPIDKILQINLSLQQQITNWVNFSLTEIDLFKKHDQMQLTYASLLLTFKISHMEEEIQKVVEDIKNKKLVNFEEIKNCINSMIILYNKEDERTSDDTDSSSEVLSQSGDQPRDYQTDHEDFQSTSQNSPSDKKAKTSKYITRGDKKMRRIRFLKCTSNNIDNNHSHKNKKNKKQTKITDYVKNKKRTSSQVGYKVSKRL